MSVSDILETRNAFSFEVFPPKTDVGMEKLCGEGGVLDQLYTLNPDYISCTYGAGGTNVGKNLEVLKKIKADGKCIPVTHFTCIGNTKEGIKSRMISFSLLVIIFPSVEFRPLPLPYAFFIVYLLIYVKRKMIKK